MNNSVEKLLNQYINNNENKNQILNILIEIKDNYPNLSLLIWNKEGLITTFLTDIISIYPYLITNNLNINLTNQVLNILNLFQLITLNIETRILFIKSKIFSYLLPFLHQISSRNEAEYLKVATLGVLIGLTKNINNEIINFFFS